MLDWPTQGHAALLVATTSIIITLTLRTLSLRSERRRRPDDHDEH